MNEAEWQNRIPAALSQPDESKPGLEYADDVEEISMPEAEELAFRADAAEAGSRLDVFLTAKMNGQTRSYIRKLIEEGHVLTPGTDSGPVPVGKAGLKLKEGQMIYVLLPPPDDLKAEPENIPLDILYEDDDVIVVNKPKGMVVHPAAGHMTGTLVNALLYHCRGSLSGINGVLRPGIVHRIDRDTTGSLVAAKNDKAHQCLAVQFHDHTITRRYRAIVTGNLKQDEGVIDAPLARHPADRKKMAIECRLETGRTHQIRVHMAHIGHPLLGDTVYGPSRCPYSLEGQTLHAMVLGFKHPSTGAYMEFTAPLPEYFEQLLEKFRR